MQKIPVFILLQSSWATLNYIHANHGRCRYLMNKWKIINCPVCDCGHPEQTPIHKYAEGITAICSATPDAIIWLNHLNVRLVVDLHLTYDEEILSNLQFILQIN
ncbi:hypothetical protein KIL84_006861 [Mauremys mutica]|uniref:Uncharacterized protein n=1 Tax=Mauremys mutica TaxID=74926 RepID=A0A9D3X266_9SAUR|nr:hypothetical protein KIL84_006861 [Mauremys mutica]